VTLLTRIARRLLQVVAGLLVLLVLFVVFGAPYLMVSRIMGGHYVFNDRENAGMTPASFNLPFEDVSFAAVDGVPLHGWWVPAASARGSVVLVHGLNRSRIEMVRKLPFLHAQGWNALALDLRHHGASGGDRSSFGYFERLDVRGAAAEAHRRAAGPVAAWGVSLGAASVMLAAAEDKGIAGVVCDSSYRSLIDTIGHHLQMVRGMQPWLRPLPGGFLSREVVFWIERKGGFDAREVDIVRAAAHLGGRPALFVSNSGDRRMPTDIAFELQAAAGSHARVLVVPGTTHGGAYREGQPAYEAAVAALLDELSSTGLGVQK
jgi:pimeloyl-ACP methyl ester carboxylesterase